MDPKTETSLENNSPWSLNEPGGQVLSRDTVRSVGLHFSASFSVTHRGTSRGIEGKQVPLLQSGEHSAWWISATTPTLSLTGEGARGQRHYFSQFSKGKKKKNRSSTGWDTVFLVPTVQRKFLLFLMALNMDLPGLSLHVKVFTQDNWYNPNVHHYKNL